MLFLLRTAFWLTIVFALLPGQPKSSSEAGSAPAAHGVIAPQAAVPGVTTFQAVSAASAAVSDASSFCTRQPQACAIGAEVIGALSERAQAGASLMLSYVGAQIAQEKRKVAERSQGRPATDTLTADDLGAAWQGLPAGGHNAGTAGQPVPLPPKRPA